MVSNEIRLLIYSLIKKKKLSQKIISKKCNVSRETLNRYLSGKSDLKSETFLKVLDCLGLDVRSLLYSETNDSNVNLKSFKERIGNDICKVFLSLNPIAFKTVLGSLVRSSSQSTKRDIQLSLDKINTFINKVSTIKGRSIDVGNRTNNSSSS